MKKFVFLLLLFVGAMTKLSAQRIEGRLNLSDTTQVHQLVLTDGSVIVGRLMAMHAETWEFKYSGKVEQIPTNKIERLKVLNKGKTDGNNDVVIMEPVNSTNNGNSEVLITPTAIPLEKGEAYYETVWGYYHYMEYGLGKGVSIGVGGAFPVLATRLRWGMSIKKNVHIGACATNYSMPLFYFPAPSSFGLALGTLGIVSANLTLGTGNRYLNIGVGTSYVGSIGYDGGFVPEATRPILSVGGTLPIGKQFAFLSDNIIYLPSSSNQLIFPSAAIRYFKKKIRFDFGLWGAALIGSNQSSFTNSPNARVPVLPYLSFGLKL